MIYACMRELKPDLSADGIERVSAFIGDTCIFRHCMMVAGHGLVGDTERIALMDRLGAFVRV